MWFCKKHSVCETCQVHFEPYNGRHAELCPQHRKPVIELEDRILRVCEWAKAHWEALEPKMLEDENKAYEARREAYNSLGAYQHVGGASISGLYGNPYNR